MAKDNSYLTSFKIDLVRQVMEGHELKAVDQKYGASKSTLWGWKCKYGRGRREEADRGDPPVLEGPRNPLISTKTGFDRQAQTGLFYGQVLINDVYNTYQKC